MNNKEINKKLSDISKKLDAESPRSRARFDPDCFSVEEKQLFAKVNEIAVKDVCENLTYEEIMENFALISKADEIMMRKAVELFTFIMPRFSGAHGEVEIWFFNQFFYNFLIDYAECLDTINRCSEKQRSDFLGYLKENNKLATVFQIRPWEPKDFAGWAISWGWDDMKKTTKKQRNKEKKKNAVY
jgi:hypothetical protein